MKPARGSFAAGLVVGLLIGLSVALGVALYITKAPVPFINKVPQRGAGQDAAEAERNKNWDPNAPLAGKNPARPSAGAVAPAPAPATTGDPGAGADSANTGVSTGSAAGALPATPPRSAAASAVPPAPVTVRPPRDPASLLAGQPDLAGTAATGAKADAKAASAVVPSFFVQAGAYSRPEDAESQRAKLALMDLAARITEREQSGRTVFRVRLGPFETRSDAEDAQGKLAAAGIDANLVRVER